MEYLVKLCNDILKTGLKATEEHHVFTIKSRANRAEETYGDIVFIKRLHDARCRSKTSKQVVEKRKVSRLDSQK